MMTDGIYEENVSEYQSIQTYQSHFIQTILNLVQEHGNVETSRHAA